MKLKVTLTWIVLYFILVGVLIYGQDQNEYDDSNENSVEKRAGVKCYANPVSCYRKRASIRQKIAKENNLIEKLQEMSRPLNTLCEKGHRRSCEELVRLLSAL